MEYNNKQFLAPKSINSMSAIHCKIYEDGKGIIRISDCHRSIRLWNFVNTREGAKEMLEKVYILKQELIAFETMIKTTLS